MCKKLVCFVFIVFISSYTLAHEEVGGGDAVSSALYAKVIQDLASMNISEVAGSPEVSVSELSIRKRRGLVSLVLGSKHYELDSGFWDLTRTISKLYLFEMRLACDKCELPTLDELHGEVKNRINQGWVAKASIASGDTVFERYGFVATDLMYRRGPVFALLKVVFEVLEDVVTGGWHFVCEAITLAITIFTKPVKYFLKGMTVPAYYGNSRWFSLRRALSASFITGRILKRLDFSVRPFNVNDEHLKHFLEDHEDKRLKHKAADRLATVLNLARMEKKADSVRSWSEENQNQGHRMRRFIEGLESQFDRLEAKLDSNLSYSERADLKSDLEVVIGLKQKIFKAKRMKRTFFLVKRRGALALGPYTESGDLFKKSEFWFVPFETEVLNPNLQLQDADRISMEQFQKSQSSESALWLARHIEDQQGQLALAKALDSVQSVFDTSLSKRQRQLHAVFANSFLIDVMPNLAKSMMAHKMEELYMPKEGAGQAFSIWFSKISTRKRFSQFYRRLDDYAYYLKFGAVAKGLKDPTMAMHMTDYFNHLMSFAGFMADGFSKVEDLESLKVFNEQFDARLRDLSSLEPWVDKRQREFSIKHFTGGYSCAAMY